MIIPSSLVNQVIRDSQEFDKAAHELAAVFGQDPQRAVDIAKSAIRQHCQSGDTIEEAREKLWDALNEEHGHDDT